ncbi:MurR/RpiR family transcriptional regulator [Lactiplantibacillus pingfangensis]|uniref:MurR/RpiR family transcriptional regulator n=1 Tax=Lactiplantibacillus pingfangensis TaxID=2559915 RepID=UPI0014858464|nr:MurR/RpiR family transcriptional regulator [Lactiplantibacillus pingfangensis]
MHKSITELIKLHETTFSNVDRQIAQFILSHQTDIASMSINALANQAFVSTSSVLRFTQKLGFLGYSDFKYSVNWQNATTVMTQVTDPNQLGAALAGLLNSLDDDDVHATLTHIHAAHRIFVLATGLNQQYQARDLQQHFLQLGINMILLPATTGSELNNQVAETVSNQDLLIIFSSSGENVVVRDFLKIPLLVKVPIIAFTNNTENWLAAHADFVYTMDYLPMDSQFFPYFSGFFHIFMAL